jgi:hypothetical protein
MNALDKNSLENRERALEQKYFLDAEMAFKAKSRRDRLLAQWVSEMIDIADIEAYVAEIIDVRFAAAGDEGVVAKILADLRSGGKVLDENELRDRIDKLMARAIEASAVRP